MVQVLPAGSPGFGSQLLGALSNAGSQIISAKSDRNNKIETERPKAQTFLGKLFKEHGISDAYDTDLKLKAQKRVDEYISKGYNATQAGFAALEDLKAGFPEATSKANAKGAQGQSPTSQAQQKPKTVLNSIKDFFNQPTDQALKQNFPKITQFLQSPIAMAADAPIGRLRQYVDEKNAEFSRINEEEKEKEKAKRFKLPKPVDQLTLKDILKLPADAVTALPIEQQMIIGQKLAQGAQESANFAFSKKAVPGGLVQGLERKLAEKGASPIVSPDQRLISQPEALLEGVGGGLKDLALFGAASGGKTVGQKALLAGSAFGAEKALETSVGEGRIATPGELALSSAFGAGGELAGPILKASMDFIKKIPSAFKSIASAVKASGGVATEEKIVKEAVKNLESRGVSVIKAAEGDKAALNEIQKESVKVANTFERAEKFNRKELEKIRGEKAEKLVQSPLEEHFKIEKEVAHRPETLAKEAERIAPLQLKIKQKERSLQNLQYQIYSSENRLKEAAQTLNEAEKSRIQALINADKVQHEKLLNDIKAAQFEIKYKRPPSTTEDIQKQIAESFEKIREGITDPTAKKIGELQKAVERNKAAVESAEKLVARGELPGPPVFDEFIKIKQEYVKAYGDLIDELKSFIKDKQGQNYVQRQKDAGVIANAQNLKKLIEQTREQAKASIVNQIDKRKALKTLSGPSGALWKNLLKEVRKDVDAFQKDWIKFNKLRTPLEEKTSKLAEAAVKGEKTAAKPLEGKGAAQEAKAEASKEAADKAFKDEISGFGDKFKKGTSTEKDVVKAEHATSRYLKRLAGIPAGLARGAIAGAIQGILEEYLDVKIPVGIISTILPGSFAGRAASLGSSTYAHKIMNAVFDKIEANKLRKLRNTPEFHKYRMDLEKRYSKARVKKIVEATQSK